MTDSKALAISLVKSLGNIIIEFEESKLIPNVVFLNKYHFAALSEFCPYLIEGLTLNYNKYKLKVIISENVTFGVAYSYHTDSVTDY